MIWIFIISACISCFWIAFEDFKTREIHLIPFLILIGSGFGFRWFSAQEAFPESIIINLGILSFIFFAIILIYRLKGEKEIMDTKMGWGDWIFLLGIAIWLDPQIFIFFYALSTISITAIISLIQLFRKLPANYPIPLAGLLGLIFAVFMPAFQAKFFALLFTQL